MFENLGDMTFYWASDPFILKQHNINLYRLIMKNSSLLIIQLHLLAALTSASEGGTITNIH
jgi:hypothetical protein